ncbi:MAG TPA: purine-nucleoside phosphorylase [Longimicrobiales bacterium]|nr:purine-nucleoside phosphorylase [Longimicrobiales bacterium]
MAAPIDPAAAAAALAARLPAPVRVGLVLGSGLGALAEELADAVRIPFGEIPGFTAAGVEGHAGALVAGRLEGVACAVLQGRPHLYEGHASDAVAFPARVLCELGIATLIVTNAAGGVNHSFRPGDLMLIDDHINLLARNPLIGPVQPGETRFPDMSQPYDPALQELAQRLALEDGVRTVRGVYAAVLGPSYETRAEVAMLRRMGADAVGMSTVPEVLVARARGVRVLGISLITNPAADLASAPLDHAEVIAAGREARTRFTRLVRRVLRALADGA